MGVKKDDVFLACEELVKKGAYVTIANVRSELGTGSYGTLVPLVAEWKKSREETANEEKEIPTLPPELLSLGQKFIADIWAESAIMHQRQVTELEARHHEVMEKISGELRSKTAEIEQSLEDIKEFEQRQEDLESEIKANESKLHQKDGEISLLKEQLKAKEVEIATLLERAIRAEKDAK
jgi:chromosome segregation ATPase